MYSWYGDIATSLLVYCQCSCKQAIQYCHNMKYNDSWLCFEFYLNFYLFSSLPVLLCGAWQYQRPGQTTENWMSSGNPHFHHSSSKILLFSEPSICLRHLFSSSKIPIFTFLRTLVMCVSRCLEVGWATRSRGATQQKPSIHSGSKSINVNVKPIFICKYQEIQKF